MQQQYPSKYQSKATTLLSRSAKITDTTNYKAEYLQPSEYTIEMCKLDDLKPVVQHFNMSALYLQIARCLTDKQQFIVTKDLYVVSDNDALAIQVMIQDENVDHQYECLVLRETLDEMYGLTRKEEINDAGQPIGNVVFPSDPNASVQEVGSGDVPASSPMYINANKLIDDATASLLSAEEFARKLREYANTIYPDTSVTEEHQLTTCTVDELKQQYPVTSYMYSPDVQKHIRNIVTVDKDIVLHHDDKITNIAAGTSICIDDCSIVDLTQLQRVAFG